MAMMLEYRQGRPGSLRRALPHIFCGVFSPYYLTPRCSGSITGNLVLRSNTPIRPIPTTTMCKNLKPGEPCYEHSNSPTYRNSRLTPPLQLQKTGLLANPLVARYVAHLLARPLLTKCFTSGRSLRLYNEPTELYSRRAHLTLFSDIEFPSGRHFEPCRRCAIPRPERRLVPHPTFCRSED